MIVVAGRCVGSRRLDRFAVYGSLRLIARRLLVDRALRGRTHDGAGDHAVQDARPISDTRGSAEFRRTLVAVLTARALADCARQLGLEVVVL